MAAPARFPGGGVTNAAKNSTMWNFGAMDPTKYHVYFNDFDTYTVGDWTITTTEAGGGDATEALTDVDGGALLITNDSGASDADYFQKVGEGFLLNTGKKAFFKTRLATSHATTADIVVGLQITDTTPLDASDGIYFLKPAAGITWSIVSRKDASTGSTSATGIATCVANTFMSLGWYYDGRGNLEYYIDDVKTGTLAIANYFPDTELTVSFGLLGASITMTVDYILAANER